MQRPPFGSTGIKLAFIILELQLDVTGDAASACTHGRKPANQKTAIEKAVNQKTADGSACEVYAQQA
jgi:hypothetical protein